jgi:hypothetical protein
MNKEVRESQPRLVFYPAPSPLFYYPHYLGGKGIRPIIQLVGVKNVVHTYMTFISKFVYTSLICYSLGYSLIEGWHDDSIHSLRSSEQQIFLCWTSRVVVDSAYGVFATTGITLSSSSIVTKPCRL